MLKKNLHFSYSYIPEIDHYLFLAMDSLLDGINKSRAVIVCGEPRVKNFHWRISLLLVCSSSLFSLPEKASRGRYCCVCQTRHYTSSCHREEMMAGKYFCRASAVGITDFCYLSFSVRCMYQFSCRCLIIAMVACSTQGSSSQKLVVI